MKQRSIDIRQWNWSDTKNEDSLSLREECRTMATTGAVYPPELIELMKAVLDDATASLPVAMRTSTTKAEVASYILATAAKGERSPLALKEAALAALVTCTHYSHDISPERRVV
jgi:hypothetical protein